MTFLNVIAFKDAVIDYILRTGRNLRQYRHDKHRVAYKYVGGLGCKWRIYCSENSKFDGWKIRILENVHSCSPNGKCEMFKAHIIARMFLENIKHEPEYYMPKKIREIIKGKWKITPTRPQCQDARNKALKWIEREYDEKFSRLRDYGAEIVAANEDSTVEIDIVTNQDGLDVFRRFYMCFANIRKTWKETCRPIIGVDGCFLKSKVKGQLLVALGRDADNRIYPIAWTCVQVENFENWQWFVKKLRNDLGLLYGDNFIIISDRQKGLIKAVQVELPKTEHRMCVRHIYGNLKKKHGKKLWMKPLIWNIAWSYTEVEFAENMQRILNHDTQVYEDVVKTYPKSWCRAFYRLGNFCEDVENNSTESFNVSIVKAKEKPLVSMLETIRKLAMVRINQRSVSAHSHTGLCTPYVAAYLAREHKKAAECRVFPSTNGMYEVESDGCSYWVSLDRRSCSCRAYDISGIPCVHVYGVILEKKLLPEAYVCQWFQTEMWRRNYADGIMPLRGVRFWHSTGAPDIHVPPPYSMPGRKKNRNNKYIRKRGTNESPTKRQLKALKRIMHCKICGAANHNSRFHKRGTQLVVHTWSQPESSQGIMTQLD